MKIIKYICIGLFLSAAPLQAQTIERSVVASSGETITDGNMTLDFTLGELAVTTITDGTTTLNQGFHQGGISLQISAEVLVFLQGAAINPIAGEADLMRDNLRQDGVLPLTSPYTEDAVSTTAAVFDVTGNDAIVDWVLVQLRDATDNTVIIVSQSGLLQRDGDVVGVDGVTPLEFDVAASDYFVSVNHRNHLGVISAQAVTLGTSDNMVDFTSTDAFVAGGVNSVTLLNSGEYAIYAGDVDENGQVLNSDTNIARSQLGLPGYLNADMDMNGQTFLSDLNLIQRPNLGRGSQVN